MNGPDRRLPLSPGMIIAQRFELKRPLGRGTMGNLWVAHHATLDIDVAVKFIDPELVDREDLRARFANEATAAARIQSPYVVNVLDFGNVDAERPYIAMELLKGETLAERLERQPRLGWPDVIQIVNHASKGLARAHAMGVVHRDLKPENLFLCDDEDGFLLKILDFGIATAASPTAGMVHRTMTGQLVGTPLYMSPEQGVGQPASPQSDMYSLASVAYHCLTGHPVFSVENIAILLVHVATRAPDPLSTHLDDVPEEVEAWFRRALSKEPHRRFGSTREMAETFTQACSKLVAPPPRRIAMVSQDSWEAPPLVAREPRPPMVSPHGEHLGKNLSPGSSTPAAASPQVGDTLVNASDFDGIAQAAWRERSEPRVRVLSANGEEDSAAVVPEQRGPAPDDPVHIGFAPTIRDQDGALRLALDRVFKDAQRSQLAQPLEPVNPSQASTTLKKAALQVAGWIVAGFVAICVAVAIGWFIGRSL